MFVAAIAAVTGTSKVVTSRPDSAFIVSQIDAAVVPWVTVSIEASGRFDGDQGRFRNVVRSILEESTWRLRTVLATVQE